MIKVDAIHWKTLELDPNEVPLKQPSVAPVPKDVKRNYHRLATKFSFFKSISIST